MVEPKALQGLGITGAAPAAKGARTADASGGVAFKALLERLEQDARSLESQTKTVEDPAALADVTRRAHASLQDALSIGDQLLEAYRQALAQPDVANTSGNPVTKSIQGR